MAPFKKRSGRPWTPRTLPADVERIYRAWAEADWPFENFRANDGASPTYGIELDLDHQASYLATMHDIFVEGTPHWDFVQRAGEQLAELSAIRRRLEEDPGPAIHANRLRHYVIQTEAFLQAFLTTARQASS